MENTTIIDRSDYATIDNLHESIFKDLDWNNLTEEDASTLIDVSLMEVDVSHEFDIIQLRQDLPMYQLIENRTKLFDYELSTYFILFLAIITNGIPGNAVTYLHYIQFKYKKFIESKTTGPLTMTILCMDIIPLGTISEKSLKDIWDNQKINYIDNQNNAKSANLFDYATPYKSNKRIANE